VPKRAVLPVAAVAVPGIPSLRTVKGLCTY